MDIAFSFCYSAALKPGRPALGGERFCPFAAAPVGSAERERVTGDRPLVQIFVRDNNVDQALKALKKKLQREGVFREMKLRRSYEKPSEKKAREKAEAVRRAVAIWSQGQAFGFNVAEPQERADTVTTAGWVPTDMSAIRLGSEAGNHYSTQNYFGVSAFIGGL